MLRGGLSFLILPLYALKSVGGTDARSYCNVRQGPITYAPDYGSPLTNRDVCMSHANEPYTCSRTRLLVVREYYNVFSNLIHAKGLLTGLLMDASLFLRSMSHRTHHGNTQVRVFHLKLAFMRTQDPTFPRWLKL